MTTRQLVEAILNNDMVLATSLFENRLDEIVEQKLYEVKRSIDLTEMQGYRGYGAKSGPLVGKSDSDKKKFWKGKVADRKALKAHAKTRDRKSTRLNSSH